MTDLKDCTGFDWDEGNQDKNLIKHNVSNTEAEQIFLNKPLIINPDKHHSGAEKRYYALGRTDSDRLLFISFTLRGSMIRIISARDMSKTERNIYGK